MKFRDLCIILLLAVAGFAYGQYSESEIANKQWLDDPVNISRGDVTGKTAVRVYGHNHALAATAETIYAQSDIKKYSVSRDTVEIYSSSGTDDSTGTGIQALVITGLDEDWVEQSEIRYLQGTAKVTLRKYYHRIFSVESYNAGSGGVAVGTIKIENVANDTTWCTIPIGATSAYIGVYTVPAGKTLYVNQLRASTAAGVLTRVGLWTRNWIDTNDYNGWIQKGGGQVWLSSLEMDFNCPIAFEEKTDIELRALGNSGNVTAAFCGWIE